MLFSHENTDCHFTSIIAVDGDWCAWGEYTPCLPHDTGEFKLKTRQCGCPAPESGGQLCPGMIIIGTGRKVCARLKIN